MLKEYNGRRIETEHIFKWMTAHVASRIKTIRMSQQLVEEWHPSEKHPVKMFLFAKLAQPPAFFSALSVKFTGRIEFIFVDVQSWDNITSLEEIGVQQLPSYILKMPEGIYRYGNSIGEFISLQAMDTFLRSVQPEVNDLFVLSLVMVNLMAWLDLFITQGATIKRFVVLISTLGTYNSLLIISWLPILGFLQLPYLEGFYDYSLKLLRYADTTTIASWVRTDWTFYSSHPALFLSTYLAHGLLIDYFEKKRRCNNEEENPNNLEWLSSLWDWYTSYLVHPITSFHNFPNESDWDDDPNFLLERLAFPDLWLHPLIPIDYINNLPTWRFKCTQVCGPNSEENSGRDLDSNIQNTTGGQTQGLNSEHEEHGCGKERDCAADSCCHSENGGDVPCMKREAQEQQADWSQWPSDMIHCTECVVCLENFETDCIVMGLPCAHVFHQQCIVVWLAGGQHCCPVCRGPSYKRKPVRSSGLDLLEQQE